MGFCHPGARAIRPLGQFSRDVGERQCRRALRGGTIYANTCNCQFYQQTYPWAFGPRLGVAYQIDHKTVFRGGWGVNYQFQARTAAGGMVSTNGTYPLAGVNPLT